MNAENESIDLRIGEILHRVLNRDDLDLRSDDELLISGVLDSMAVIQLAMELEHEFEFQIPAMDITIENFESITAMSDYVAGRLT